MLFKKSQRAAVRHGPPKTNIAAGFVPLLLLLAFPGAVQAQFDFVANNGTITITGYTGSGVDVVIPSTINGFPVTVIGKQAFFYSSIRSIRIPEGLIRIGDRAFSGCSMLLDVSLPSSVCTIESYAFSGCTRFTSVSCPEALTNIGSGAFSLCRLLSYVSISANVTSIGWGAFSTCDNLREITVDSLNPVYSSVEGVLLNRSQTVLIQCPARKGGNYTIPESVIDIAADAFHYCSSLTNIVIPNSITSIGASAFRECTNLIRIAIPEGITTIEPATFENCRSLTSFSVPNSVTNIGDWVFLGCKSLVNFTFGSSVSQIGERAFESCYSLTNVQIPESVMVIEPRAFSGCVNLTNVTIPDSVICCIESAFWRCPGLTAITVGAANPVYSSVNGVLFNKSQTVLIQCPSAKDGRYTIPEGVTIIDSYAFSDCSMLTNITMPRSVTYIDFYAFESCIGLTSITITASVTHIRQNAFTGCRGLTGYYFEGNAPEVDVHTLDRTYSNTTVYYLPGTSGWGATLDGRPTAFWHLPNPWVLNYSGALGVQTNGFSFVISWATNSAVVVETRNTVDNGTWLPIATNIITDSGLTPPDPLDGWSNFIDPDWTNSPSRFYRVRAGVQ